MFEKFWALLSSPVRMWRSLPKWSERNVNRTLRDFLPPSLEVLEKPPHPAPRILLWVTVAIFLAALVWAIVGKVDIITTAEGKLIPGGKVKVIQPFERGVVSRIWVAEGQMVKEGQPLIEMDHTQTEADKSRLTGELEFVDRTLLRKGILVELVNKGDVDEPSLDDLAKDTRLADRPEDARLLLEEWKRLDAEDDTLRSQLAERQSERRTARAMVRQYEGTLPLITERVNAIKPLYEQKIMNKMEFLSVEEERVRQVHALEAEKAREEQLAAAIVSMEKQLVLQKAKNLGELFTEIEDLKRQRRSLAQELAKSSDLNAKEVLASPVDGTVKGLAVHTVGGVVNPAEVLMEVVPLDAVLEVEAFVGNQDIGYVQEGQTAEIKVHTFPFTRYGVVNATVESVARDATVDEKLGLIYRTRLKMEKGTLVVNGAETPLLPGMAVTAEIATDQRRLIEFFLAPLLRAKQESLRER